MCKDVATKVSAPPTPRCEDGAELAFLQIQEACFTTMLSAISFEITGRRQSIVATAATGEPIDILDRARQQGMSATGSAADCFGALKRHSQTTFGRNVFDAFQQLCIEASNVDVGVSILTRKLVARFLAMYPLVLTIQRNRGSAVCAAAGQRLVALLRFAADEMVPKLQPTGSSARDSVRSKVSLMASVLAVHWRVTRDLDDMKQLKGIQVEWGASSGDIDDVSLRETMTVELLAAGAAAQEISRSEGQFSLTEVSPEQGSYLFFPYSAKPCDNAKCITFSGRPPTEASWLVDAQCTAPLSVSSNRESGSMLHSFDVVARACSLKAGESVLTLLRHAAVLSKVTHRSIRRAYGVTVAPVVSPTGADGEKLVPHIILEKCFMPLSRALGDANRAGKFNSLVAASVVRSLALGMREYYAFLPSHGGVKLDNIFVRRDGSVCLAAKAFPVSIANSDGRQDIVDFGSVIAELLRTGDQGRSSTAAVESASRGLRRVMDYCNKAFSSTDVIVIVNELLRLLDSVVSKEDSDNARNTWWGSIRH